MARRNGVLLYGIITIKVENKTQPIYAYTMITTQDKIRFTEQILEKLREKQRYEHDQKEAQEKIKQNPTDTTAAEAIKKATEKMQQIDREITQLKRQIPD